MEVGGRGEGMHPGVRSGGKDSLPPSFLFSVLFLSRKSTRRR